MSFPKVVETNRRTQSGGAENALAKIETGKRKHVVDLGAEEKSKKKKKKKPIVVPELKDNNLSSEKKKRKKKPNVDPEAAGNNKERMKDAKENQRVDSEAAENNNDATPYGKEKEKGNQVELVRGKRFTKEEDELIKKSVLGYVEAHVLGDQGVNMGIWIKEDFELVKKHQKKHGNHWKTLADVMGKNMRYVRDAWRRMKFASKKNGRWSREEYQNLFDLVNKDLRMKAFQKKRSQHGMLRDNIPWMSISNQLGTRENTTCCRKWYDQLTSPMVAKGIWANVDDYMLLDELTNLDAACVDDVDWDDLLDNRDGDACRSRWNQMVRHIGLPGTKTFAEQVEIVSQRYCPDITEDRQDFDNRPYED
ncbi:hypothetical protein HID58_067257 [Brassica napus]|uniref:BnaC05g29960D protein n=2 Tax=Brassica napus TaxID=3708 RepID=A0A078HNA2_BRANA|nr:hypothetical protein HID58_067257 [Brassica napus]CAF1931176.1 unnamed protein product [Brassica napus]CDY38303.1 BnaC05g29960D [Brassica napus]